MMKGRLISSLDPKVHEISFRELVEQKDGELKVIGYEIENVTFNVEYDKSEKEPLEGEIIYFHGHPFRIVKEEKEFPNGIFIPYFINLRLERLPDGDD